MDFIELRVSNAREWIKKDIKTNILRKYYDFTYFGVAPLTIYSFTYFFTN